VGNSVYLDAGREMGLIEGQTAEAYRDGERVAVLKVSYLSSRRASCSIVSSTTPLEVGDSVRFTPGTPASPVPVEPTSPAAPVAMAGTPPAGFGAGLGLRGRIGVRYLTVRDRSGLGEDFSQPSLDLNLLGTRVGGSDLGLAVDVRARRTYRIRNDGVSSDYGQTRAYRLSASWQGRESPFRITAGRQMSSNLASVSLFDGALVEYMKPRLGFGVFAGSQPDPLTFGFSTDIVEYGAYALYRRPTAAGLRWSVAGGWTGSYASGTSNREYVFLRAQASGGRFYGNVSQEIDVNRGWKLDTENQPLSFTSTFLNLRYQIDPRLGVTTTFDNRRRVRLYRDRDTPESAFDDSYRQGWTGGLDLRVSRFLRMGLGLTQSVGETAGDSRSYTLTLRGLARPLALGVHTRTTRYTGPWASGWLNSLGVSRRIHARVDAELYGGLRSETRSLGYDSRNRIAWWGLNLDFGLARGWYLLLSAESTSGAEEDNDQAYASLSYRF